MSFMFLSQTTIIVMMIVLVSKEISTMHDGHPIDSGKCSPATTMVH